MGMMPHAMPQEDLYVRFCELYLIKVFQAFQQCAFHLGRRPYKWTTNNLSSEIFDRKTRVATTGRRRLQRRTKMPVNLLNLRKVSKLLIEQVVWT